MKRITRADIEIGLALATAVGKIVFVNWLDVKFWFIIVVSSGWLLYLTWHVIYRRERIREWGFRAKGFLPTLRLLLLPASVVVFFSYGYGLYTGQLILTWRILPVLLLYPIWGTIQQWLVICLFGKNLLEHKQIPEVIGYTLTALLFSAIHYPSTLLMGGTFVLSFVYLYVFSKNNNLFALGLLHGWLGGIFFYFALGRDAWLEFTKAL